ncbi:TonB-dependent receptor [Glaciimonas soli]|uniref:TonB-dependent receptor n=1 Tax=Glaciimonas soli TaxID=2590999 RepID=A0A843YSR3_9BURK|nr:TonB-dependent receptor [Glaciimonas soli]MQR00548.1 TonB-dependent receptor [Glaciimonas soli]
MRAFQSHGKSRISQQLQQLLVLSIAAACNAAYADDTDMSDEISTVEINAPRRVANEKLLLDRVSSGSRLDMSVRETPASISIVDRSTIEARGASDTQQILNGVPGITAASPPGSAGFVSYRGFSGSQITQLFNGITVQYDAIAARPIDSWIIDRVETVGGASSFLYGSGAVGGSINYITKLANRDGNATDVFSSAGTNNSAVLAAGFNRQISGDNAETSDNNTANYLRIDVSRSANDGDGDYSIEGERRRASTVAVSLLSDITPQLSHTLAYEYQNEIVKRPYWGTPVLNPIAGTAVIDSNLRFKNYNAEDGRYDQSVQWLRSMIDYRLSDATSFKNTLYHYQALRNYRNIETYRYTPDNSMIQRSGGLLQRHEQDMTGNRFEVLHKATLAGLASDWAAGADYSVNRVTRFPRSYPGVIDTVSPYDFNPGEFFDIPGMTLGNGPDKTNRTTTLAVFLENRTQLLSQLALVSALRHDQIDLTVTNKREVTPTNPAFFKRSYQPTTGRLGLVYDITPHANVYVQYSTAADPPSGVLSTANLAQVQDFGLTTGRQFEVGSKIDFWNGRGNATIAAYTITRKNLAIADVNNPGMTLPVGRQSSKGIELAFGVRASQALKVQGNLALVSAQYDDFMENVNGIAVSRAGKRPTNTPTSVANLWLDYSFMPNWSAGADARYVSSVFANNANTVRASAYTIFGVNLSYRLQQNTTITARIKNLTDKIYAAYITGTPMVYLGAPRTFEVSLAANF